MQKCDLLRLSNSCLNKARYDEPVFLLRANDPAAPQTIRHWATMSIGLQPEDKVNQANDIADQMEKWHMENVPHAGDSIRPAPVAIRR